MPVVRERSGLWPRASLVAVMFASLWCQVTLGQGTPFDSIEFLDGRVVEGKILEIRKAAREFDFTNPESKELKTYEYSHVHAVTFNGRRFVLTEKRGEPSADAGGSSGHSLTKAEILQQIDDAGRTPPDWFDSTPLDHPDSLELDWPLKADGPWDESKNVGQYIWGRVNPNSSRWKSGIKLVHECMNRHPNDPKLLQRDMEKVGIMYFELLQDYPRAAFWLQRARVNVNTGSGVALAECYWKLGSKTMAEDLLRGSALNIRSIKLLAEMNELQRALSLAERYVQSKQLVSEALLAAGDAARNAGQLDKAIRYYEQVLQTPARNKEYEQRYRALASGGIESIKLFDQANVELVADGTYTDSSMGYNGELEVQVTVKDARIEEVQVTNHEEKQFYAALTDTPNKIIAKQSIRGIDGTSGATITSQAIVNATARALAQGAK
jgi:uncharacterized protein with FMN-binding domain